MGMTRHGSAWCGAGGVADQGALGSGVATRRGHLLLPSVSALRTSVYRAMMPICSGHSAAWWCGSTALFLLVFLVDKTMSVRSGRSCACLAMEWSASGCGCSRRGSVDATRAAGPAFGGTVFGGGGGVAEEDSGALHERCVSQSEGQFCERVVSTDGAVAHWYFTAVTDALCSSGALRSTVRVPRRGERFLQGFLATFVLAKLR
jgi:hypothetical protein